MKVLQALVMVVSCAGMAIACGSSGGGTGNGADTGAGQGLDGGPDGSGRPLDGAAAAEAPASHDAGLSPDAPARADALAADAVGADLRPEEAACIEAWRRIQAVVVATSRPDPATERSLRLFFSFTTSDPAGARIVLDRVQGSTGPAGPSEGPFSTATHSGAWAELRDAADRTLHTLGQGEGFVRERVEIPPPPGGGGFSNVTTCPREGAFFLFGLPNLAEATHLVLFQEPVDGQLTGRTVEFARFRLP